MLRNRTLLAVSLVVCAAYTGIGMIGPVRVLYAQSRGASLAIIGTMSSAYLISNFLFQYPSGWLADRFGRKPMMLISLFAQAALSLAYLFISDPILFVVLRFAEGIAAAAVVPSARALVADSVPPEHRGQAYGIFGAFFNTGFLLGPALGGLLATTGYASSFIGAVIFRLLAVVIVITMVRVRPRSEQAADAQAARVPLRKLFTLPLIAAYILVFGDWLYVGFDITLVPLWMHDHLGASVAVIGFSYMAWSIPNVILTPFTGRVADRVRRSLLVLIFGLAQVPLYVVYGLANTFMIILIMFVVHGAIYSMVQPAVDAHLAAASGPEARGRVQGMYYAFGLFGGFIGSNGFSLLYGVNFRLPLFAIGAAFGLCVLIGAAMMRVSEDRGLVAAPGKQYEELERRITGTLAEQVNIGYRED